MGSIRKIQKQRTKRLKVWGLRIGRSKKETVRGVEQISKHPKVRLMCKHAAQSARAAWKSHEAACKREGKSVWEKCHHNLRRYRELAAHA